ncbi:MAG: SDR family oxidoreductase [Myxococcota bacterium]
MAVVTGGGSGIGAYIAHELGQLGANVVIASRKKERIESAAAGLSKALGREALGRVCDIRDRDSTTALVEQTLARFGRLDILVNNGGGQFLAPAEFIRPKGWDAVIHTNLTGTWNLTRAAADQWMLKNGGRIMNITMMTRRGFPGMAHSVSARAGVEAMTRTLAIEWATYGILINSIQPGVVASNGLNNYPNGVEMGRTTQKNIPLKRLGSCNDIAWMCAFLASPAGSFITGQTFAVDGGQQLWGESWPINDPDPLPTVTVEPIPWEIDEA